MKIALGSDHGGFELKKDLQSYLAERGIEVAILEPGTKRRLTIRKLA